MRLVIEAFDFKHAQYCIKNNVDAIIVGTNKYAVRNTCNFSNEQIEALIKNKNNTQVFVKVNAPFFEADLEALIQYLIYLSQIDIDGVIFSDYAVAQINNELNLNLNLKYNPETLVTSYYQFDFFYEVKFKSVTLARELPLLEIEEILNHKKEGLELEIQGHGYLFMMHSRWNLISNFEQHYDITLQHEKLKIREELRKLENILKQDEHGTHMFSGYIMYTLDILSKIKAADWLRIDTLFLEENDVYFLTDVYQHAITLLNTNEQEYLNYIHQQLPILKQKSNIPLSHGFLGNVKDLLHMVKNDEK